MNNGLTAIAHILTPLSECTEHTNISNSRFDYFGLESLQQKPLSKLLRKSSPFISFQFQFHLPSLPLSLSHSLSLYVTFISILSSWLSRLLLPFAIPHYRSIGHLPHQTFHSPRRCAVIRIAISLRDFHIFVWCVVGSDGCYKCYICIYVYHSLQTMQSFSISVHQRQFSTPGE